MRDRTSWLFGEPYRCLRPVAAPPRAWRLVLIGPPGAGKGTQAALLSSLLGACPLSTGDVFRAARSHSLPPGSAMAEAQARMERGLLVPDDIVIGLLHERRQCLRCRGGVLLDGFPRTVRQAIALEGLMGADHVPIDAVISYEVPLAALVARTAGRRQCPGCHAIYHVLTHPPQRVGVCDHCGSTLVRRRDDEPAATTIRLQAYAEASGLVERYYEKRGLLVRVPASDQPEQVFAATLRRLSERGLPVPLPESAAPAAALRD